MWGNESRSGYETELEQSLLERIDRSCTGNVSGGIELGNSPPNQGRQLLRD